MTRSTLSELKAFLGSSIYLDIKDEIQARRDIVEPLLIKGDDSKWSDDNMRGRLNELDFIDTIIEDTIESIEMEENKNKDDKKKPTSFMEQVFETFKKGANI